MATRPKTIKAPPLVPTTPSSETATPKRGRPEGKKSRPRENAVSLADLLMWISICEACLVHPVLGLSRAAQRLDVDAVTIHHCLNRLERALGFSLIRRKSAKNPFEGSKRRGGLVTVQGIIFVEICVCIEHLWTLTDSAMTYRQDELLRVKDMLFSGLSHGAQRGLERRRYGEIEEIIRAKARQSGLPTRQGYQKKWDDLALSQRSRDGEADLRRFKEIKIPV
jgi:hypothetical protein